MADPNRVRNPLEFAAESTDPVVREMAIRRIEIGREIVALDMFFNVYEDARTKAEAKTASKQDLLADKIKAILLDRGPLDINALHEAYLNCGGDTARTREALRVALTHRKQVVDRVSDTDRRYWLVGVPLNGYAPVA